MSTWKAVYVPEDTPTETEGWYVVGFADSISPVVLKVEGSDTDGLREAIAGTVAKAMNRSERNHTTVTVTADTPAIRDVIEKRVAEMQRRRLGDRRRPARQGADVSTPSQRGKSNRRKGAQAERDVVTWLRANGWPHAERAIATGNRSGDRVRLDPGDITGTPGLVWQVKDRADITQPAVLYAALSETEEQRGAAMADFGLLVARKRGTRDVGEWTVWMPAHQMLLLTHGRETFDVAPVSERLSNVACWLRLIGYGDPIDTEEQSA